MTDSPLQPDPERLIDDLEALRVYFDPTRARIMQALAGVPRTIQQVAEIMDVPFTRLYYQFNLLEKHGLIRVVERRALSGVVEEKYYQVTAYNFIIDRALLTVGTGAATGNAQLESVLHIVFDGARDDIRRSAAAGLIDLSQRAPDPRALLLRRGMVRLTPTGARRLYERMLALMETVEAEDEAEDETLYGFTFGLYPSAFDADPTDE